ncbi:MAG: mechanosensitive ion channel family protein [Verrucomicrobiota bacterium]
MRKLFSFVLLVATAIAWFSVVAPAQESPAPSPAPNAPENNDETFQKSTTIEEATILIDEETDVVQKNLGDSIKQIASEAVDATGHRTEIMRYLNTRIGNFRIGELVLSFLILLFAMTLRNIVTRVLFSRIQSLTKKTAFEHDDQFFEALQKPASLFLLVLGIYLSLLVLPLRPLANEIIQDLFRGGSMLIIVWAMIRATDVLTCIIGDRLERQTSSLHGFIPTINKSLKIFIVIVGLLLVVDNLGYNVSGILATLGLGGAAIAFASQDTIKNLFGTFMIMLDRPFKVGDWIMVGDKVDGDVEAIGLRSTKVRTWPKTVISIPNGVLANEYINNWTRMPKRRVKQVIGITYEATPEDMEALVEDFRNLLQNDEGVNQEFILVNFTDFGGSSLDILVYYFTRSTKWLEHMDVRQRINCKIMRAIRERGLTVAFPTRTLYLEGNVASQMAQVDYQDRWDDNEGRGHGGGSKGSGPNLPDDLPGGSEPSGRLPGDWGPDTPH